MSKVLVIGLDGATWDLLKPWMKLGVLPNLSKLMKEGSHGDLRSTIPTVTATAWASFITGKEPSENGIFAFNDRKKESYKVYINNGSRIKGIPFWNYLSINNKKSILINVPMTYPAHSLNGYMISGLLTPDKKSQGFTYPVDLFEIFHLDKSPYMIRVRLPEYEDRYEELIYDLKAMIRERLKIAITLIRENWDFFMVHFFATDIAQHALWKFADKNHPQYCKEYADRYGKSLIEIFEEVDKAIGVLLEKINLENTAVMVISDHGFGPNLYTISINKWLEKIGMLKFYPPLLILGLRLIKKFSEKLGLNLSSKKECLVKEIFSFPAYLIPLNVQTYVFKWVKKNLSWFTKSAFLFKESGYDSVFEAVDWQKTKAYSIGTTGRIYINLKGREPKGSVAPGEKYREVRNFILEEFYKLVDKEGNRLIDKVYCKDEIYHGKYRQKAPDLIPTSECKGCYFYPFLDKEDIISEAEDFRSGNHRLKGIFIAKGQGIRKQTKICEARIIDLAPTILYLSGIKVPDDMNGRVLFDIFKDGFLVKHTAEGNKDFAEKRKNDVDITEYSEKKLKKKLEDLGYV